MLKLKCRANSLALQGSDGDGDANPFKAGIRVCNASLSAVYAVMLHTSISTHTHTATRNAHVYEIVA